MNAVISRGYTPACILDSPSGFIGGTIVDNHNLLYYVLMLFICCVGVLDGCAGRLCCLTELLGLVSSLREALSDLSDLAAC